MTYLIFIIITVLFLILLGLKWQLKPKIVILWTLVMCSFGCISIYALLELWPQLPDIYTVIAGFFQTIIITSIVILWFFFRDPERTPPDNDKAILSPADGTIVYVREIINGIFPFAIKGRNKISLKEFTEDEFISDRGIQIGIGMNLLNVHVNRSPIKGEISRVTRVSGQFSSLKKISSLLENERVFTVIDGGLIKLGIVQIASRLVRRIVPYVKAGDRVSMGQRLGIIRFGSQVDLLISFESNLEILVKPGDEVKAGVTIIATY